MALGRRKSEQQELWVATSDLPRSPGHPFYRKLNVLLREAGFDAWVEKLCRPHYAEEGRPGIPPGVYFRMILVGYFEGIASQRGIAWRCSDSRSLAEFLGLGPTEETPDHSSLTRVHQRLPLEVHEQVFQFVLKIADQKGLLKGRAVVADSTFLEANAAMKSIVRKDTGESWNEYLRRLMEEQGLIQKGQEPSAEELRRFDQQREDKSASNTDWESKTDPDSRIMRMKDKSTHLAYKAEHVVDEATDLVLAAEIYHADQGDPQTLVDSVMQAQVNVQAAGSEAQIKEVAADKGYHAAETLELAEDVALRTYIPERKRKGRSVWTDKPKDYQRCVYNNRRRMKGDRGKSLAKRRSELAERSFAHICETGGGRRCWLHGLTKVKKRYLLQAAARNLGLILRKVFGVGSARSLQGAAAFVYLVQLAIQAIQNALSALVAHSGATNRHAALSAA